MKKRKWISSLGTLVLGAVLAGILAVAADFAALALMHPLSVSSFLLLFAGLTAVFFLPGLVWRRQTNRILAILLTAMAVTGVIGLLAWDCFGDWGVYRSVDSGKEAVYGNRKVMLIVPHQDDDINVLGGVMEEYVAYGSQVYPVFVTNGDFEDLAEVRFREALDVCRYIGIPEENVIFMGYGDTWSEEGPHLYNAAPGEVMTSCNGKTETYGTSVKGVFREGRTYTIDHLLEDMQQVILTCRPDVIICSDYDSHIDHRAVSLLFDKAMGILLKENPDYRPVVLKGYAYMSAWYAPADYYEENILSTVNVFEDPCYQYPKVYRWEERVRLPVAAQTLNRSLLHSGAYKTMGLYDSQDAQLQMAGVANGDKVLWKRDTNSLCLEAEITVSSGDGGLLNDFMLLENRNLVDSDHQPFDGVWIPETEEKWVCVTLAEPYDLDGIVLYDHPSESHNILNARIEFDDGTQIHTGPLNISGAGTVIPVERCGVSSFRVCLEEWEGEEAGLTEIEAFLDPPQRDLLFVKLMDPDGNFAYDYWTNPEGYAEFTVYTYPYEAEAILPADALTCSNAKCQAVLADGKIRVYCPEGESTEITVRWDDRVSDTICVGNPHTLTRWQCNLFQNVEEALFVGYCEGRHWQLATVKILDLALNLLGMR